MPPFRVTLHTLALLLLGIVAGGLDAAQPFSVIRAAPVQDAPKTATANLRASGLESAQTGAPDLVVRSFELTQGVPNEPLIVGKQTAARVSVALPADTRLDAQVQVQVDNQTFERTANLLGPVVTVTLGIDAPRQVKPVSARVSVNPTGGVADPHPDDNTQALVVQTVQTTEKVVALFLPVDWTPEDRNTYNFDTAFRDYVGDGDGFIGGTYPLPSDHVVVDYTMTPHMLSAFEKTLADSQGQFNIRNALALYGSLSIAGRRYRPDATMVVGVLPPGWFRKHGQPGTVGLALSTVSGIVTGQYESDLPPIVAAHEIGHLYDLDEDYDFAVKPNRPCLPVLVPGYWVQREQELRYSSKRELCTFMSAASSQDAFWVDPNIYDYLLAKFAINGGTASSPMILAATMTWRVERGGFPGKTSANVRRFEPNQSVYVSVAGMALRAGSTLEAKLYRGSTLIRTAEPQRAIAGNKWYPFLLADSNSLAEGTYRAEIFLDGQLVKSNVFEVRASH